MLIPTYNNSKTIAHVLEDVLNYTDDVCVVNDGSTDKTPEILAQFPNIRLLSYPQNRGKGYALQQGFSFARNAGYDYAITIDSDGQHYASDLPEFITALREDNNAIFIGARNMTVENVPGKSSFGNKFSNFWFRLETGINLPDTQSGYRLYPIRKMEGMRFFTRKYEFEIEVIVRCAWKDITVKTIPIKVYYPPASERVSHFRPWQDFTRISLLNTVLVLWTFLYIKPRNLFHLFQRKKLSEIAEEYLFRSHETPNIKAASVALGLFFGIAPFWGFQMLLVALFCRIFKLNTALSLVVSNISIPPMIPALLFLSYLCGEPFMPNNHTHISFSRQLTLEVIHQNIVQYIIGSFVFATLSALAGGLFTYFWVKGRKSKQH